MRQGKCKTQSPMIYVFAGLSCDREGKIDNYFLIFVGKLYKKQLAPQIKLAKVV